MDTKTFRETCVKLYNYNNSLNKKDEEDKLIKSLYDIGISKIVCDIFRFDQNSRNEELIKNRKQIKMPKSNKEFYININ